MSMEAEIGEAEKGGVEDERSGSVLGKLGRYSGCERRSNHG